MRFDPALHRDGHHLADLQRQGEIAAAIREDARWLDFIARSRRRGRLPQEARLDPRGAWSNDPKQLVEGLGRALHEIRERRLNPNRPQGWPVLPLRAMERLESILARLAAAEPGESVTIRRGDVALLATTLRAALELLQVDWADAAQVEAKLLEVREQLRDADDSQAESAPPQE